MFKPIRLYGSAAALLVALAACSSKSSGKSNASVPNTATSGAATSTVAASGSSGSAPVNAKAFSVRQVVQALPAPAAPTGSTSGTCSTVNTTSPTGCITPAVQEQLKQLGDCKTPAPAPDLHPTEPIAACGTDGKVYVLAPAAMGAASLGKAAAEKDETVGEAVLINWNSRGTGEFAKLTAAVTTLAPPLNQLAFVVNGVVQSAPRINGEIDGGEAQIVFQGLTAAQAAAIAAQLNAAGS